MANPIDSFRGDYRFLSNFYPAKVQYLHWTFPTVEHAYQASKVAPHDIVSIARILGAGTPGEAKRVGGMLPYRANWVEVQVPMMKHLLMLKFDPGRHPDLARRLLATGDAELIEGNTWGDIFWGVCQGEGSNMLGRLLMEVRETLRG